MLRASEAAQEQTFFATSKRSSAGANFSFATSKRSSAGANFSFATSKRSDAGANFFCDEHAKQRSSKLFLRRACEAAQ
ncbi:hypothetical protein [Psychrobacillus sp.]|uniref:hypothetical protein n=1 Tax=Psychrobacillus sp. TaxID=1871623 RepID=UPI0028BEF2B9|nr:hypothetical protein [Psychrobacillus sp.]